ncbi:MAG: PhzF family phenazine biosynthesis protein [Thermotogota bacterium]
MNLGIFQIDAFTNEVFKGNPAGVCVLEEPLSEELYQNIAAEMNLSETAFVIATDEQGVYDLRWFTPEVEVPLCGHGTLSAAFVLSQDYCDQNELVFKTKSGILKALCDKNKITLDFPMNKPVETEIHEKFAFALNYNKPFKEYYSETSGFVCLLLEEELDVRSLDPDFHQLKQIDFDFDIHGLIVTAKSGSDKYDFVSRTFVPWEGIDEDPVTGSAHTVLGPLWAEKLEKTKLTAYQASRRGGFLYLDCSSDKRIKISGEAVQVFKGIITV